MTRTLISLDPKTKAWLDRRAAQEGVAMTELVRRAVRLLREQEDDSLDQVLNQTSGIWKSGDGVKYQQGIRDEWKP